MKKLADLILDDAGLAEEEMAAALSPYLRFTAGGQLVPETRFTSLPAEQRVLCVMLGLRALKMLEMRNSAEATPAEIVDI